MKIVRQSWHYRLLDRLSDGTFGWGYLEPKPHRVDNFCAYARRLVFGIPLFFLGWAVIIIPAGIAYGGIELYYRYKARQYWNTAKLFNGLEGKTIEGWQADLWLMGPKKKGSPYLGFWRVFWNLLLSFHNKTCPTIEFVDEKPQGNIIP